MAVGDHSGFPSDPATAKPDRNSFMSSLPGERRLWISVLATKVEDLSSTRSSLQSTFSDKQAALARARRAAVRFIKFPHNTNSELNQIACLAGLEPEAFARQLSALYREGWPDHGAWGNYDQIAKTVCRDGYIIPGCEIPLELWTAAELRTFIDANLPRTKQPKAAT
jgi:hypothetical protein